MSHSENPYEDGDSEHIKSRNDMTPCTISGSSSENNLYASPDFEQTLNKGYSSEINLDSLHMQMGQIPYQQQQQYKASLRRKCKEGALSQEIYSKMNRSIDTARNYSNHNLELLDFYEESPSRSDEPKFREMHEHYMVPTHDPNRVSKKSLSLFNPQFLPNFNDIIMYVAQNDNKDSRQLYTDHLRSDDLDFMKPGGYRNDMLNKQQQQQPNIDSSQNYNMGLRYPQNSVTNEDIFILKRELRESTWKDKYDLRDCAS